MEQELAKNSSSEQVKKLAKIALASRHGLNYFTSAVEDWYYPTNFNWGLRQVAFISNKVAFCASILTVAAYSAEAITDYTLPVFSSVPWQISMVAMVAFNALRYLNIEYRINPSKELLEDMRNIFENAIAPKKAAA